MRIRQVTTASFIASLVCQPALAVVYLKQSTSVDVSIGPFVDATDGVTAETGLTITQPDVRLKKNNGNWEQKAASQTLSHEENGYYEVTLDATDTNTLGTLRVAVSESGALPVWQDFMVVPANVWDSLYGADKLQVDVMELAGGAQSGTQSAADLKDFADNGYDPTSDAVLAVEEVASMTGQVTVATVSNGAITNTSFAIGAIDNAAFNVAEPLNADVILLDGSELAADKLRDAFDEAGGSGVVMELRSLTISNSSGTALTISSTGGNGHGLRAVGNGTGDGISVQGGSSGDAAHFRTDSTGGHGIYVQATGSNGHAIHAAADSLDGLYVQGGRHGAHFVSGTGPTGNGIMAVANSTNGTGLVVTGNGTGHGALFTSGSGATGNGIQATAASTNGSGLGLTGMGTGFGLTGSIGGTVNANVIQWLATGVTTNVNGVPKVDITHVLGDPVCD